jgi:tRNA-binding protein
MIKTQIQFSDFEKIDIRIGTVIKVENFEKARNPSYKLWIDFGELGIKKSSAQLTTLYKLEDLIGKQICAVVNFEPRQIADFMSEVLVLGAVGANKEVTLLVSDQSTLNGLAIS